MQSYVFEQTTSSDMIPDIDLIEKSTRKSNELKAVIFEVQGEFEFSEDPPGNRIFDHQIAKLKTQIFFLC